jgi:hypothetical protein
MTEQTTAVYEPPALVELGEFSEDTLGHNGLSSDGTWYQE